MKHFPRRIVGQLTYCLTIVLQIYSEDGFIVRNVLMDIEFDKIKRYLLYVVINIAVAKKHVGKVDRKLRVIKEGCDGTKTTSPFQYTTDFIVIEMVHFYTI